MWRETPSTLGSEVRTVPEVEGVVAVVDAFAVVLKEIAAASVEIVDSFVSVGGEET